MAVPCAELCLTALPIQKRKRQPAGSPGLSGSPRRHRSCQLLACFSRTASLNSEAFSTAIIRTRQRTCTKSPTRTDHVLFDLHLNVQPHLDSAVWVPLNNPKSVYGSGFGNLTSSAQITTIKLETTEPPQEKGLNPK